MLLPSWIKLSVGKQPISPITCIIDYVKEKVLISDIRIVKILVCVCVC